jgi:hypothetical protein
MPRRACPRHIRTALGCAMDQSNTALVTLAMRHQVDAARVELTTARLQAIDCIVGNARRPDVSRVTSCAALVCHAQAAVAKMTEWISTPQSVAIA